MDVFFVTPLMFLLSFSRTPFRMDGEVIHVYQEPSLRHLFVEYSVHHHLESGGGIHETKEHNCWFEKPFWGEKRRFPFVSGFYAYIVISLLYVKLGK